jgi:hypothetical protein
MVDVYANILDRLFAKYRYSQNILGVLEILSDPIQDTDDAIDWLLAHLSIDEAEGELLDFMASWIGVSRPPAQEENIFLLFRDEEVADDPENNHGLAPDSLSSGGYLSADDGCLSKSDPGSYVDDETFRTFIRAKAATFRKKATPEVMFEYILSFGIRTVLHEDEALTCEIEPSNYEDMTLFIQNYIETRGFRPAGIKVRVKTQTYSSSEI